MLFQYLIIVFHRLPLLVNFENELDNINEDYVSKSKNYYSEYEMKKKIYYFKNLNLFQ